MSDQIFASLEKTENLNKELLSLSKRVAKAGDVFHVDIMTMAVVNRSLELSEGFKLLIEDRKFLCAAPLLRLQIDNLLRYSATWLVERPDEFVAEVMKGTAIRKLKDASGNKMFDAFLVEKLSANIPWIPKVYEKTCGYVHLSESHFHHVFSENDEGKFSIGIGSYSNDVPDSIFLEAVEAFNATTYEICKYVYGWLKTKDGSIDLAAHNKKIHPTPKSRD
ncbi:MAG: hypothetical protein JKY50_09815 [Oleispira sp.]|nr:hypothetical protein [Oleispira sp.]MBL4880681.1 hypothetical protein [Oleispira sp.]